MVTRHGLDAHARSAPFKGCTERSALSSSASEAPQPAPRSVMRDTTARTRHAWNARGLRWADTARSHSADTQFVDARTWIPSGPVEEEEEDDDDDDVDNDDDDDDDEDGAAAATNDDDENDEVDEDDEDEDDDDDDDNDDDAAA